MSKELAQNSPFFGANIVFINEIYQKFLQNPASVDASWVEFFKQNSDEVKSILADYQGPSWASRNLKVIGSQDFDISSNAKKEPAKKDSKNSASLIDGKDLNLRISNLISAYKKYAHLAANLDPIGLKPTKNITEIDISAHGIEAADLEKEVEIGGAFGLGKTKINQLIEYLNFVYANKVGAEFEYITNQEQKTWLAHETENAMLQDISKDEKLKILKEIIRTESFEQFLHKRFPGAKRFSIEGGDSSINSMEKIIEVAAKIGVKKIIIGMAHRGRLNTLTGVMGKPYHQLIAEFKGTPGIPDGVTKSGDVKYHMGYASKREIKDENNIYKIDLSLAFNPSHLEAVNTVVTGRIRAKQALYGDADGSQAMALLIHGDAAFAGQGLVAESLMMNGIEGYNTGGVIHIIINNQIGFTANPSDSRSTTYASDLAKAIEAPIFHINGDDVESVVKISELAMRYRQTFKKDIVLDIICYRRYGHNEGDEPLYTQPLMYAKIKDHPTLEKIYAQKLIEQNVISQDDYKKLAADFNNFLAAEFEKAESYKAVEADWLKENWSKIQHNNNEVANTKVAKNKLKEYAEKLTLLPSGFSENHKIHATKLKQKNTVDAEKEIDWGCGEALAFASLLDEGFPVRITGQDSGRGTFSHRHSILHDTINANRYNIFSPFAKTAKYEVYDSLLSEYGVLGFEYGYSLSMPYGLTIWEAQFGDFANGAQIIFDQFIASSEVKWLRKSGLVMLLPHGYEGQGPEHSSARLERYLQACADNNIRVCNITNPANFFHALRRQVHDKDRKPLVVMSPKSLLRHKLATATLNEFSDLNFRPVISESSKINDADKVRKVIFCSGKVYFDLFEAREAAKIKDVAIIRLEQIYPFATNEIKNEIKKYKNAEIIWCQEEPKNMGAWSFVHELFAETLLEIKHKISRPKYIGRIACASPATGYSSYHAKEQKKLIDEALN
ncbi:MAG: 2-oxoglutarate dehydrogenase E1 component [Rickettsiales bacterium]|nr:2-oxoglutarate dehydrogenase E1 component [Rickettsiales bacterium]